MNLESQLITEPQLLYSPYLSEKTGLNNVSILDYSCTSVGTHKLKKAIASVLRAREERKGILLFINPVVSDEENSRGSGIDAVELASAAHYPESQVIEIFHRNKPLFKVAPVSENFPNRKRIILGLNLDNYWTKEKLKLYFKRLISGGRGTKDFKNSRGLRQVRRILKAKGLDASDCLDITNLDDCGCYAYSSDWVKKLGQFDYLVGSAGTGERALGQILSLQNGKTNHIIVIPKGHPLDPYTSYEESDSKRVQVRFEGKIHRKLNEASIGRTDVFYKSAGLYFGGKQAKEMFVDPAIREDRLKMRSSYDGAIGFAILKEEGNPEHKRYFTDDGLKLFNTHRAEKEGFRYLYPHKSIPLGSKVCIINTGLSNNLMYENLVGEGIVK